MTRIIYLILIFCFFGVSLAAQPPCNVDGVKLMGQRVNNPETLNGSPFLFSDWVEGSVVLTNGEELKGIQLQYDALHDELLTYSNVYFTTIKVEKATIRSFQVSNMGENWFFEQRNLKDNTNGNSFFRVLHKGEVELLAQYTVSIESVSPYTNTRGMLKNQEYVARQRYFMFSPSFGLSQCRLYKKALLRRIGKGDLPRARKLLRHNHVEFGTAVGFARALEILEANLIKLSL